MNPITAEELVQELYREVVYTSTQYKKSGSNPDSCQWRRKRNAKIAYKRAKTLLNKMKFGYVSYKNQQIANIGPEDLRWDSGKNDFVVYIPSSGESDE